ncbi:MAG TPA: SIMPL domain-containing protein [Pyrinomonadaceae bacterium]|nr:SIMPL domain-containing protein [Pyrinomonadaceae bacterium]
MYQSPFRIFGLCLLLLLPHATAARQKGEQPLITVSGQAEIRVPPDEVNFSLEVTKLNRDLTEAQKQNDDSVRDILALARRFDVPPQDVKTDYISVEMKYSTDLVDDEEDDAKKVKRELLGYEVSKTVIVRFKDLPRFEKFFAEVLKAGVSKVNSVEFRTSQIRKHKDQARALAIRAAREKAIALTAEIGQTIGKAHSIQEEGFGRSSSSNNFSTVVSGSFSSDEDSAFAPGMITVTAQVTVSFVLN